MKRISVLLSSLLLVVFLAACNNNTSTPKSDDLAIISSPNQTQGSSSETENTESQSSSSQEQISSSDNQTSLRQEQASPTKSPALQEQEYISAVLNPLQQTEKSESSLSDTSQEEDVKTIQVIAGNKTFTATLSDNAGADAFVELLRNEPFVINMSDYSGFEKVGSLGTNLPASNSNIVATEGDIILYNENQICVFYGSNSWSYTRLAKIDDLSGWKEALGSGDVTISFSLL